MVSSDGAILKSIEEVAVAGVPLKPGLQLVTLPNNFVQVYHLNLGPWNAGEGLMVRPKWFFII